MENWKEINIDLGTIKTGETVEFYFEYIGNPRQVRRIKKDCGCTLPIFEDNKLLVKFTPYSLSKKMQAKFKTYQAEKKIQVIWKDSTMDLLTFKALVSHE